MTRRDIWDDPHLEQKRPQPTASGFMLAIAVMILVVLLAGTALASCGIPWATLD